MSCVSCVVRLHRFIVWFPVVRRRVVARCSSRRECEEKGCCSSSRGPDSTSCSQRELENFRLCACGGRGAVWKAWFVGWRRAVGARVIGDGVQVEGRGRRKSGRVPRLVELRIAGASRWRLPIAVAM